MNPNKDILQELVAWGHGLQGFKESHAIDGLTMAQGYVEGVADEQGRWVSGIGPAVGGERTMFLIALDLSWLLWLDDRFDNHASSVQPTDWQALLRSATAPPTTPESEAFYQVRTRMAKESLRASDYKLWLDSALALFEAYHENELLARGDRAWGYAEYLDNEEIGVGMPHLVATISLVCDYRFADRLTDPQYTRVVRSLALTTRLQNDLASLQKERRDGDLANAVLLMERFVNPEQAWAFALAERQSHERLLHRDLDALPPHDPLPRLARIIVASTERYYRIPRERYISG
jgi:hypothetical protein